jgi:hypothetical protein
VERRERKPGDDTAAIVAEIEQALKAKHVTWGQVLLLAEWDSLSAPEDEERRKEAKRLYRRAREAFQQQNHGAELAIFPPIRSWTYLLGDGDLQVALNSSGIRFNAADAWRLVLQIDSLAEEVKEWLQDGRDNTGGEEQGTHFLRTVWRFVVRVPDVGKAAAALRPHSLRAFSLVTGLIEAVSQENRKHPEPTGEGELPDAGEEFETKIRNLRSELISERHRFREAAQRIAQGRYWQGTMVGAFMLFLFSLLLGLVFWWRGADAAYGIALPAGGIGAMVSVLQRMTSRKLVLDVDAGRDLIEAFGAIRPLIGAVFGMALMALLLGGLIPAIDIPEGRELAFFAGLGFLAGFNERWAQDMLKGSAGQLQPPAGKTQEAGLSPD